MRAKVPLLAAALTTAFVGLLPGTANAAADPGDPPTAQIIGGKDVPDGKYPFIASLQARRADGTWSHFCGGSLIDKRGLVLTAAHCAPEVPPEEPGGPGEDDGLADFRVVVGRTDLTGNQGYVRSITGVRVFPDFAKTGRGDVALLFLDEPVAAVQPAKLVTPGTDALERPGRKLTVAGWGNTGKDPGGPGGEVPRFPDRMQEVNVPVVSDDECKISYGREYHSPTMVCAGVDGKDSCQGDSGGPLFTKIPGKQEYMQAGVVSWGFGCAAIGNPGVYAQLSNAKVGAWIQRFGFE